MKKEIKLWWGEQELIFHPERAIYFPLVNTLLISDLHLGKSGHFRKHGIAIPQGIAQKDLKRLSQLLHHFSPEKLIIAGDFFHADKNNEIQMFQQWIQGHKDVEFILIKGNHDKFKNQFYEDLGFTQILDKIEVGKIIISHDILEEKEAYQITGHLHPGVILHSKLKQRLRIPAFAYHEKHIVLPAFSKFTGLFTQWEDNKYDFIGCTELGLVSL